MAANLSTGNFQTYDGAEGIRILQGIHGHVIFMQEMNFGNNTSTSFRALTDQICGPTCVYTRGTGSIPNGIVSAYPFLESGAWPDPQVTNRNFVWVRIDVPGPVDLWAVSVHFLTTNATVRGQEASALLTQIQAKVPMSDYLIVGGDFNTDARGEQAITTLAPRVATAAPYPVDANGNDKTNSPRNRPYDWVLPSPGLMMREAPVMIGAATFAHGLVVDTRIYNPITDITPAMVGDSAASGMQHMAVVRDFLFVE